MIFLERESQAKETRIEYESKGEQEEVAGKYNGIMIAFFLFGLFPL